MSEKEPASPEKNGSLKCQRKCSSSNIGLHTRYSPDCRRVLATHGGIICC